MRDEVAKGETRDWSSSGPSAVILFEEELNHAESKTWK
jgi:hypothetical protein